MICGVTNGGQGGVSAPGHSILGRQIEIRI